MSRVKVAVLETGAPPKDLQGRFERYPAMFRRLLGEEAYDWSSYDVLRGQYPSAVEDHQAYLVTGSAPDAEDAAQDAFVKAYRARDRFAPTGRVEAWLCTIAVREAISRMRWSALQRRVLEATSRAGAARPVAGTAELLDDLLAALSPKARAVVVLHFLHGYRYREIAAMLGLPEGTVASRLSHALTQMRRRATGHR